MKKLFFVFALSLFTFHFSSCTQFWFSGIVGNADELKIQFYSHNKNIPDEAPVDITSKNSIDKICSYILEDEPTKTDCGYDGILKFMSNGQATLDVEFVMNDTCQYVAFVLNNKINYRKLSAEGVKYLRELKN